jgi:alpha-L-rhamnosidase
MKKLLPVIIMALVCLCANGCLSNNISAAESISPVDLRCEYLSNPLGIDVTKPRLSWKLESGQRGQKQTAYRLLVASSAEKLKKNTGDLWDSGKVRSDQSVHVTYDGKELISRTQCFWKVMVWPALSKVEGACPEPVEGACPEPVEGAAPSRCRASSART